MYHYAMVYSRSEFMMIANKTDTPVRVKLFDQVENLPRDSDLLVTLRNVAV